MGGKEEKWRAHGCPKPCGECGQIYCLVFQPSLSIALYESNDYLREVLKYCTAISSNYVVSHISCPSRHSQETRKHAYMKWKNGNIQAWSSSVNKEAFPLLLYNPTKLFVLDLSVGISVACYVLRCFDRINASITVHVPRNPNPCRYLQNHNLKVRKPQNIKVERVAGLLVKIRLEYLQLPRL